MEVCDAGEVGEGVEEEVGVGDPVPVVVNVAELEVVIEGVGDDVGVDVMVVVGVGVQEEEGVGVSVLVLVSVAVLEAVIEDVGVEVRETVAVAVGEGV